MTYPTVATRAISTPNQSTRGGRDIRYIVLHGMASTGGEGVLDMMRTGSKQVSANAVVLDDGTIVGVVPEENRSWSLSDADWDGMSLTVETENSTGSPSWLFSDNAYTALGWLVADWCARYGIPMDRAHVLGHREVADRGGSYATACPQSMDIDRVLAIARGSSAAGLAKTPIPKPIPQEDNMALIRTAHHGHYTAAPGVVISHPNTRVTAGIEYRKWGVVMDISPDDLADYLFALAGCPKDQIPAGGTVWYGRP